MTNKLYTEEQVRKAIELARDTHQEGKPYLERDEYDYSVDEVVDLLTPIELPSDEEIINNAYADRAVDYCEQQKQIGFEDGAKWLKDKILTQNK